MSKNLKSILSSVPAQIVNKILDGFTEIESRFSRGDWKPAELNGAKFAEAIYRYLEWKKSGNFTAIGTQLNRSQIHHQVSQDTSIPDGLRFQLLKCLDILFDVRNKRDVAHLGDILDVNEMDSRLVMRLAFWSLAEIIREESNLPKDKIQELIDSLSAKTFPIVEEINGDIVILSSNLKTDKKVLVALYHKYSEPINQDELYEIVGYSSKGMFKSYVLDNLSNDSFIHISSDNVYLTEKGIAWIEQNIDMELKV